MAGTGTPATMKPQSRREPDGPVIDETAFQQLLSAAFVMQEHNGRLKKAPQPAKPTMTASPVVPAKGAVIEPLPLPETKPATSTCQECGSTLARNEFFCDTCGALVGRAQKNTKNKKRAR